jgi:DNA-binding Lrp family transcriptional regulator
LNTEDLAQSLDVELLMEFQYNLPLTTTPIDHLADLLRRSEEDVLNKLKEYLAKGVVKRYGLNLNYRAFSGVKQAALVGFKVADIEHASRVINRFDEVRVKHNFLREGEFSVWFTIKAENIIEIEKLVGEMARECRAEEYVVLPTKRVYKMDVKYDLKRGVSWSKRGIEPGYIPMVKDLGFEEDFVRSLESLDLIKRPFSKFKKHGYGEEEVVSIIEELMKNGVGRDFSGVLRESRIGFRENGMTVLRLKGACWKTEEDKKKAERITEKVALKLHRQFPEITHLVERIANEKWDYPLYFMVHATTRHPIERIRKSVLQIEEVADAKTIYSKRNLRET